MVAAYKRPASADRDKWLCSGYYATPWLASDTARSALMPINRRWPVAELLAACNDTGLNVADQWTERFFGDFVIGVAMAQPPPGDDVPPARLNQDRDESTNVS